MTAAPGPSQITLGLVLRARAGDRDAYDRLFALASERALLFIRLRLGARLRGRLDSMDVLQEAYVEALRAFPDFEFRGDDSFSRWICRLIENRIRGLADHFDAAKRRPPGAPAPISQVLDRVRATTPGPSTQFELKEDEKRLAAALERLADDEREALLLRFFQERDVDDIARLTGASASSVRRLVGRATAKLGGLLGEGESAP